MNDTAHQGALGIHYFRVGVLKVLKAGPLSFGWGRGAPFVVRWRVF